ARSRFEEGKAVLWENGQYQWAGARTPLPRNAAALFCLQNTCGTKSESFASSSRVLHSLIVRPARIGGIHHRRNQTIHGTFPESRQPNRPENHSVRKRAFAAAFSERGSKPRVHPPIGLSL